MNINYVLKGKGIKISTLKKMLHNSYKHNNDDVQQNINGYELDKQLSGKRVQVYHNKDLNHTIISHRGTQGLNDWLTDAQLLFGNKNNNRLKQSNDISNKAHQKYKNSDFTQIGHSLGSELAKTSAKEGDELIKYNGATIPSDLFRNQNENEYDIRTSLDPISVLQPLKPFNKNDNNITIPSDNFNLIDQHSISKLDNVDENKYIGK